MNKKFLIGKSNEIAFINTYGLWMWFFENWIISASFFSSNSLFWKNLIIALWNSLVASEVKSIFGFCGKEYNPSIGLLNGKQSTPYAASFCPVCSNADCSFSPFSQNTHIATYKYEWVWFYPFHCICLECLPLNSLCNTRCLFLFSQS